MGKLYLGTEELRTKAAVNHLKKNIDFLQKTLDEITSNGELVKPITEFYSKRLESKRALLSWLQDATR